MRQAAIGSWCCRHSLLHLLHGLQLTGCCVLCLSLGGLQQGPILAAAGAEVFVFDVSEKQLLWDRMVADRDGVALRTIQVTRLIVT